MKEWLEEFLILSASVSRKAGLVSDAIDMG
jgi:hypothetical protein